MLLAGKSKGFLAVGSHNLTYAGFGHNREVTNAIRYNALGSNGALKAFPIFAE
jgi:phosphatidylserine/phosphatidylglycerophosphate/cardiolipin synthase-like enzyme